MMTASSVSLCSFQSFSFFMLICYGRREKKVEMEAQLDEVLDVVDADCAGQEEQLLSSLLAGATDQTTLERQLEQKLSEDLLKRDNENDEKRLMRTRARIRIAHQDLRSLNARIDKGGVSLSAKSALLEKASGCEETISRLKLEERDILARIEQRKANPMEDNAYRDEGNQAERDLLIRTGKIMPFDRTGVAENAARTAGAGRSVKDLIEEKTRLAALGASSASSGSADKLDLVAHNSQPDRGDHTRPPIKPKRSKLRKLNATKRKPSGEDSDYENVEDSTIKSDDDEIMQDEDGTLVSREQFETTDDGDEFAYQKRYARWVKARRIARLLKEDISFTYDSDDEDCPLQRDPLTEPIHPHHADLTLTPRFTVPGDVASKLFPYQLTTLSWLLELHAQETGGILGDEMGLGKTIQMIAFMAGLHRSGMLAKGRPVLVVAPATVLRQWVKEFHEWWGALRVVILHSSGSGVVGSMSAGGGSRRRTRGSSESEAEETEDESEDSEEERKNRKYGGTRRPSTGKGKRKTRDASKNSSKSPPIKVHKQIRELVDRVVKDGHVLLTTYEGLRVYKEVLIPIQWTYAILDEGHKIRNADADITLVCKRLKTPHRIILSGTPIQNNLKELWSLYDFVFPGRLGTLPVFLTQFEVPIRLGAYANASNLQVQTAQRCASVLRDLISPYLLRRLKCDVAADLPQKTESVLFCKLTREQRKLYEAYIQSEAVLGAIDGKRNALGAIDGVRKICNHPDLLHRETEMLKSDYGDPRRSGKMQVLKALLSMWKRQGHRALVFCQTRQMQDILNHFLIAENYTFFKMDGMTPIKSRIALVDAFNADPQVTVFLLTTKVGGLGINLTGANRVLIYDPDWNPSTDVQARERAWRLGQTRDVAVYRLMMSGTIEEKIYHRQIYKQFMTNKILADPGGAGGAGAAGKRFFDARSLKDLFVLADEGGLGTETGDLFRGTEVVKRSDIDASVSKDRRAAGKKAPMPGLFPLGRGKGAVSAKEEEREDQFDDIADIAKVEEFQCGEDARKVAEVAARDGQGNGEDEEDSRMLFSLLHSTVAHDKIMNGDSNAVDPLTRAEADRVAREAADEVRLSRKRVRAEQKKAAQAHGGEYVGLVTFTGNSGTAGRRVVNRVADLPLRPSRPPQESSPSLTPASIDHRTSILSSLVPSSQAPSVPPPPSRFGGGASSSRGGLSSASLLDGLRRKFKT
ncbi:SNF2 family N-terminal domain-containing protein [Chytriomyces sp. MP71]|nr:SNF2 family N-terminal domain-containing protein [Chytriomyces sp. MP71]